MPSAATAPQLDVAGGSGGASGNVLAVRFGVGAHAPICIPRPLYRFTVPAGWLLEELDDERAVQKMAPEVLELYRCHVARIG